MPKKWLLGSSSQTYVITRARDLFPEEQETLPPGVFAAHVDGWLSDARSRQTILDICESITGRAAAAPTRTSGNDLWRNLKPQLEGAFRRGELVMLNTGGGDVFRTLEEPEATPPPPSEPSKPIKQLTWIVIELINDKGQPVPKERYRIKLPDDTVEDGYLDSNGQARLDGINPGVCEVSFPDIDANEWHAA
jgi:hypothetical protein